MPESLPQNKQVTRRNLLVMLLVALTTFISVLIETSMNVTFPTLMKEMNVSLSEVQWVTTSYLLASSIIITASSFFKQNFSNRELFTAANLFFIIGGFICIYSPNFLTLIVGRILQACCAGISLPLMINIIFEVSPREKVGFYSGLSTLILMIAPATGPVFGGIIDNWFNWRIIFIIIIPISIIVLLIGFPLMQQYTRIKKTSFDYKSLLILILLLTLFNVGINKINGPHFLDRNFIVGLVVFILFSIIFVSYSLKKKDPLLNLRVFKNKAFIFSFLAFFLIQFINMGINFLIPNYPQLVYGASSLMGGLMMLPANIIASILQPFFGKFLDLKGARMPIFSGVSLLSISLVFFLLANNRLPFWFIGIFYIFFRAGCSLAFSNTQTNSVKIVSPKQQPDASSILSMGNQFAGSVGTIIMADVMNSFNLPQFSHFTNMALGSELAGGLLLIIAGIASITFYFTFKYENPYDVSHEISKVSH